MRPARSLLMRAFGRPRGLLGRLGGRLMARMNARCGAWVADRLRVGRRDAVLELGFGPGVLVQELAQRAPEGWVAGVDPSREMLALAQARNAAAIGEGRVDLRLGSAERLPFEDASFDKALAVNSMQVWPDPVAGLREVRRVLRPGGRLALAFTPRAGPVCDGLDAALDAAGFAEPLVVRRDGDVCVLARRR